MTTYQLLQQLPDARADGRPDVLAALLDEIGVDVAYVASTLGTHWRGLSSTSPEARRQQRIAARANWIGTVEVSRDVLRLADLYAERDDMQRIAFEAMGIRIISDPAVPSGTAYMTSQTYAVKMTWDEP